VLIEECRRHPFKGTGKPEPLKGDLAGWWSRRTTWGDVPACVADRERRLSTSARLPGLDQASGLGDLPRPLSAAVRSVRATSLPDMAERAAQPAGGRGLVV
jgi:hypothetical protein